MADTVGGASIAVPCVSIAGEGSISVTATPVSATSKYIEQELIYSATQATAAIVDSISHEIDIPFKEQDKKQITEIIDTAKTYISEFNFSLSWNGINLTIKRSPQKIIKYFKEENS